MTSAQPQKQGHLNGRYSLDKIVGKGGMAMVYLGRDIMLERNVAIKILRENYSSDAGFRERFREEAKAVANLTHSNIVTVYDFGLDSGRLFIVMEYVPGKDLNTIISQRGRLKVKEGLQLSIQACMGLGFAHRAGFVHCDVKPHNFIVTPDWRLKVTDFGIARALASINPHETSDVVWGSPQYFSPEQASGQAPSPSSDVYSMGVVMYQMFTGQTPFQGKTSGELARLHRKAIPIPPAEFNPNIPKELDEVILKVLSKEPSSRYRTADQLGRVLQTIERRLNKTNPSGQETLDVTPRTTTSAQTLPPLTRPNSTSLPRKDSIGSKLNTADTGPNRTTSQVPAYNYTPPRGSQRVSDVASTAGIDWMSVSLAFVALSAVAGLLPFWLWVYTVLFPPK